jgi:ABC-type nitrate/sulfonate/bicarbonate transport system substrate-binding protein
LEPALVDAVEHYKNFLRDFGFLAADFDIADWVDRRHIDGFAARAVA